jgi:hypothetical protein
MKKEIFTQYTELEFLNLVKDIYRYNDEDHEKHLDKLVGHFNDIEAHPAGSDLIYWPEPDLHEIRSPERIVEIVKTWRAEHGLPGFKED